ncbi:unnamed protein product [Penicillium viridicatum]
MAVDQVIPRSATLYHELFHLANRPAATPDALYGWGDILKALKKPRTVFNKLKPMTNEQAVRQNPETYVFFSVGYWHFMQDSKWGKSSVERWSFESGAAASVLL